MLTLLGMGGSWGSRAGLAVCVKEGKIIKLVSAVKKSVGEDKNDRSRGQLQY